MTGSAAVSKDGRMHRSRFGPWFETRSSAALLTMRFLSPIAQQPPDDLAARRHRQFLDKGNLARIFMRRQFRLHEVADFARKRIGTLVARLEHDKRLHDLGAHRIGLADDGRKGDRRMLDQAILDLARPHAIAARRDYLVL